MIAIVDYDAGNICSVENALRRLGVEYCLTSDPEVILNAQKVILPGVGSAAEAMASLEAKGLCGVIRKIRKPVLGICVGMQIMCRDSEEGNEGKTKCLGIYDSHVVRFSPTTEAKVPHMGWNSIGNLESKGKIFNLIKSGEQVYFVHSYYPTLCPDTIATCRHGDTMFSAALRYENFYGTQFHPEKSGDVGERILKAFVNL